MIAKDLTYLEIRKNADKIAILPVGSLEQHGPYIPIGSDAIAADAVAKELEKKLSTKVVVYPTLYYGCSKEHRGFPGTTYFEYDTYYKLMIEVLESIFSAGFKKVLLVAGHGGNHLILQIIQANWNYDHPDQKVFYHFVYSQDVIDFAKKEFGEMEDHAGSVETSVIYAISQNYIKTKATKISNPDFQRKYTDSFSIYSTKEMSKSGVISEGNNINISIDKGKEVFAFMVKSAMNELRRIDQLNLSKKQL